MDIKEYIREIINNGGLEKEQVLHVLNYLITTVRNQLNINSKDTRICKESSLVLWKLCEELGLPYIPMANNEYGLGDLEHHYGILGIYTDEGIICFLLDATYIQFTDKFYSVEGVNVVAPGEFISEKNRANLVNNGFIALTYDNINDYIGSFISSCKCLRDINDKIIYNKLYYILDQYNINIRNKDYLQHTKER